MSPKVALQLTGLVLMDAECTCKEAAATEALVSTAAHCSICLTSHSANCTQPATCVQQCDASAYGAPAVIQHNRNEQKLGFAINCSEQRLNAEHWFHWSSHLLLCPYCGQACQDQCVGDWGIQAISTAARTHLIPIVKHSHDAWSLQLLQV